MRGNQKRVLHVILPCTPYGSDNEIELCQYSILVFHVHATFLVCQGYHGRVLSCLMVQWVLPECRICRTELPTPTVMTVLETFSLSSKLAPLVQQNLPKVRQLGSTVARVAIK